MALDTPTTCACGADLIVFGRAKDRPYLRCDHCDRPCPEKDCTPCASYGAVAR